MFKRMLLAAGLFASVVFTGCASTGSQTPDQIAANLHTQVVKACAVASPTITSLSAMSAQLSAEQQADLAQASTIVTAVCSAQSAPITSVAQLINVGFPLAIKIVAGSPMDAQAKTATEIGLTAASVAVSAALAQYAPAVAVPASAASGV